MKKTVALLWLFASLAAHGQDPAAAGRLGLAAGDHAVGFQWLDETDGSRLVTNEKGDAFPRPIRIHLWYPANRATNPILFRRYAELASDDIWPKQLVGNMRDALTFSHGAVARSLDQQSLQALLHRPVLANENAKPLRGPFPLILVGPGIYYESPLAFFALAEYLAGHGFVVATAPLVGTTSPFVKVEADDLETQVRDLELVLQRVRRFEFVSPERVGVLGFDMGGMAGVILAMRDRDVDAFVSMDAGILYRHPSGLPASSPSYDALALRVPWLHITETQRATPPPGSDATSLFERAVHANRYLMTIEGIGHEDFTSYALIPNRRAMPAYWPAATQENAARHKLVAEHVLTFFAAYLRDDAESKASLARDLSKPAGFELDHREATPPTITYDALVETLAAGKGEKAVRELRAVAAVDPHHALLQEERLWRIQLSLGASWGLEKEALPLIEYTAELYPESRRALGTLAGAYFRLDDLPHAQAVLGRYLERYPDDKGAQAMLEQVRTRAGSRNSER
jgi:dienelactone hydrolase